MFLMARDNHVPASRYLSAKSDLDLNLIALVKSQLEATQNGASDAAHVVESGDNTTISPEATSGSSEELELVTESIRETPEGGNGGQEEEELEEEEEEEEEEEDEEEEEEEEEEEKEENGQDEIEDVVNDDLDELVVETPEVLTVEVADEEEDEVELDEEDW